MADKGYGNSGKIHTSRKINNSYPYRDPVELTDLDDEVDDSTKKKLNKKIGTDNKTFDPFGNYSVDKFYFVGGNTKLKECFEESSLVLEKITSYARMFSPVPKLNKGTKTSSGGASFPGGVGNFRRIGMKQGWSSAPPEFDDHFLDIDNNDDEEVLQDEY